MVIFRRGPPNGGVECRSGKQKSRFLTNIWLRHVLSTVRPPNVIHTAVPDRGKLVTLIAGKAASFVVRRRRTTKCLWQKASTYGEDNRTEFNCTQYTARLSDQRQRSPDDRKYWAGNVVWSGDVEWLTVNDVGRECLYSSRPGTREPCTEDGDALWPMNDKFIVHWLWLPVCSGYVLGRRASAIPGLCGDVLLDIYNICIIGYGLASQLLGKVVQTN